MKSVLVYGYGNPGRQDDGLGPALVNELEQWVASVPARRHIVLDSNYQLNAEDALAISGHEVVIFADATQDGVESFSFRALLPEMSIAFSTHAMAPATVLALCDELYGKCPTAWMLTIRGHCWEPNAPMTPAAAVNLAAALVFIKSRLMHL